MNQAMCVACVYLRVSIVVDAMEELMVFIAEDKPRRMVCCDRQQEGVARAKESGVYKVRVRNDLSHWRIIVHRSTGRSIAKALDPANCSAYLAKLVSPAHQRGDSFKSSDKLDIKVSI